MYNHDIETLIRNRRSVRTYSDTPIDGKKLDTLKSVMKDLSTDKIRFEYVRFKYAEGEKFSTYGFIKGAEHFIVGIVDNTVLCNKDLSIEFGYLFEQIILKATDLDIATCWMAGTFKADDILDKVRIGENERLVMLSPIGVQEKQRIKEKLIRSFAKSDKRKPWQELFFEGDPSTPLEREGLGGHAKLLDMVQLAPSACNAQPWRIIVKDDRFDFYAAPTKYADDSGQRLNVNHNDLGIVMAHFELTASENNIDGEFKDLELGDHNTWEYIRSWVKND